MNVLEIMEKRHSVRQYLDTPIENEKRTILNDFVKDINANNDLNIQIIYDEPKCFSSFMAHYGKFSGVGNYIALVGKKSKDLDVKLGFFGESIVLKAQELGLNTCWVALTHGKCKADIKKGEKLLCIIALGYGKTQGVCHKSKPLTSVCNYSDSLPQWFLDGVNASLLAPTAMNQQKFYFNFLDSGDVVLKKGTGFYTKLDLGIVKYHFEQVSEKKCNVVFQLKIKSAI